MIQFKEVYNRGDYGTITRSENNILSRVVFSFAFLCIYYNCYAQEVENYRTPAGALIIHGGGRSMTASIDLEKIFSTKGRILWSIHAGVGLNYDTTSSNSRLHNNVPVGMAVYIPISNDNSFQVISGINSTFGGKTLYKTGYIISGTVGMRYYSRKMFFIEAAYNQNLTKVYTYWSGGLGIIYQNEMYKHWSPLSLGIGIFFNKRNNSMLQ